MTIQDFQDNYTSTIFHDQYKKKWEIKYLNSDMGLICKEISEDYSPPDDYKLRENYGHVFLLVGEVEYLVDPTEEGFDLIKEEQLVYSLERLK